MYSAVKNNVYYDNSVCKGYGELCSSKIKTCKKTAKKRNELEIKLISILLIFGNILAINKGLFLANSFFGCFLIYTVIFSFGFMVINSVFKKIKLALRAHK